MNGDIDIREESCLRICWSSQDNGFLMIWWDYDESEMNGILSREKLVEIRDRINTVLEETR